MQRDRLLVEEMIDATTRAIELVSDVGLEQLEADRDRRDALLWNFTVLGEAATQISPELKSEHEEVAWSRPSRPRNRGRGCGRRQAIEANHDEEAVPAGPAANV